MCSEGDCGIMSLPFNVSMQVTPASAGMELQCPTSGQVPVVDPATNEVGVAAVIRCFAVPAGGISLMLQMGLVDYPRVLQLQL